TSDVVVITINVAVTAPTALNSWDSPLSVWSAHWRARLPALAPDGEDRWWTIDSTSAADSAATEIATLVANWGVPILNGFDHIRTLLSTLQAGQGRGLTPAEQTAIAKRLQNASEP